MLRLQRSAGNRAVAEMIKGSPPAIRRHAEVVATAEQWPTYRQRAALGEAGFGNLTANRGWIRIGTPGNWQPIHHETSVFGVAHTEERLIAWALLNNAVLNVAPFAPGQAIRIHEMYTERRPCTAAWAQNYDPARHARPGNGCSPWLQGLLHASTPVYYSVPNTAWTFRGLMYREVVIFIRARERNRVEAAYAAKLNAIGAVAGTHPALDALRAAGLAALTVLGDPANMMVFNAWRTNVINAATAAVVAIGQWAPAGAKRGGSDWKGPRPGPGGSGGHSSGGASTKRRRLEPAATTLTPVATV